MELLMNTQKECQQLEVYGEYLKKIPELLKQLETVEKMYQKAVLEEKPRRKTSLLIITVSSSTTERLHRIKEQCEIRSADIRRGCTSSILELKSQIEAESSVLKALPESLIDKNPDYFSRLQSNVNEHCRKSESLYLHFSCFIRLIGMPLRRIKSSLDFYYVI